MTKSVDTSLEAIIGVFTGSSGSGKSSLVKKAVRNAKRLIVFDPDDEYGELPNVQRFTKSADLIRALQSAGKGSFRGRIVAQGSGVFDVVCNAAFAWRKCAFVAEELAGRTSPAKAPPGWHKLVSRGRKYGISIYAVTQRIAESDKTVIGNASFIFAGRMSRSADRKLIAQEIDVDVKSLAKLKNLEFVYTDMTTLSRELINVKTGKKVPFQG